VPARRIKIEFYDQVGTKHTITIDGEVNKEKVTKILDYVELMGRASAPTTSDSALTAGKKFERIRGLLVAFKGKAFRSTDVKDAYRQTHGEEISLSTVCTYLSRFVDKGVVLRSGSPSQWLYAVKEPGTFSWNNLIQK
jgi:hypothetical protein